MYADFPRGPEGSELVQPAVRRLSIVNTFSMLTISYADNKKSGRYQKPEFDNSFLSSAIYIKNLDNRTVGVR
jgi:hypothetical protein